MIPQRARICIAGVSEDRAEYGISLWDKTLLKFVTPNIIVIPKERLITTVATVQDIDLMTIHSDYHEYTETVDLFVERDGMLAGIVGWFELEMTPGVWLRTAPGEELTHWQHCFFPIRHGFQVLSLTHLKVFIMYRTPKEDYRGMRVDLSISLAGTDQETSQSYQLR